MTIELVLSKVVLIIRKCFKIGATGSLTLTIHFSGGDDVSMEHQLKGVLAEKLLEE